MSMLAEPRRKQKWTLDPRGKRWSEDSNKFGQRMLEKMGWTNGKGLGINEQGITKHITLEDKCDKSGIGYDKNDSDGWTEHQEKFNQLLQELPSYKNQEKINQKLKKDEDLNRQSLESKSKGSLARMHYKKFTRGKDVSKYSSKDVMQIFGKKESTSETEIKAGKDDHIQETIGTSYNTGGVITVNSGNMADYFKNKLPNHRKNLLSNTTDTLMAQSETEQHINFDSPLKTKNALPAYRISKEANKKIDYAFDNPCLRLNSPTETVNNISSPSSKKRKKQENVNLHINKTDMLNVKKKLKIETIDDTCKNGFINPALNLDTRSNENCNGKEFEVSRAQFGLENCGFDLMDEKNDKKRVTFNDHVEYRIDAIKKKKEKATLDKFEIENKHKKKRKYENITTPVSNGFVNKALDIGMLCEEINDNDLNEHKSKKIKKKKICKTSNLETIQESPEREEEINDMVSEKIILDIRNRSNRDTSLIENEETDNTNEKLKKKKKKKKTDVRDITLVDITSEETDIEIEEKIKDKKTKVDKSKVESVISKKHKKRKKKNKRDCETDSVRDTITEIHKDLQDAEILAKPKTKQQNEYLIKDKNTITTDSADIEILSVITSEKGHSLEGVSLEYTIPKKKKKNHKKDCSKNEIIVCEEKEISDKENTDEMQGSNIRKLPKKDKKHKKSKKDDVSSIEDAPNPNAEMVNASIGKENAEFTDASSKENKAVDVTNDITHSPWNDKIRMSKKMLKILFYKNLSDFPGSNIHEIKGYGVDIDSS